MGLEVLVNALKAAINAGLNVNTGALRWQGAMTRRLEVGVGVEKKNVPMEGGAIVSRIGAIRCSIDFLWAEEYRDAFKIARLFTRVLAPNAHASNIQMYTNKHVRTCARA